MMKQVHFNGDFEGNILCWHWDLNPQPTDSCLHARACLLNMDLHLSDRSLCRYWKQVLWEDENHFFNHRHPNTESARPIELLCTDLLTAQSYQDHMFAFAECDTHRQSL